MRLIVISMLVVMLLAGCKALPEISSTISPTLTVFPDGELANDTDLEIESLQPENCVYNQKDAYQEQRLEMVNSTIEIRGVQEPNVLKALRCVPRHEFVQKEYLERAYGDHPLPIGFGQTISQPYIVAWMTELLELVPGDKVLEIGTGSGYQAAVLAELGDLEIYTIEIVPELAESAAERLEQLGYTGIQVSQGDGYYGWSEDSRFDAIIVTAAPDHLPAPLAAQLADGGRLVIPIGPQGGFQTLWVWVNEGGELKAFNMGLVSFVPFTGEGVKNAPSIPPY